MEKNNEKNRCNKIQMSLYNNKGAFIFMIDKYFLITYFVFYRFRYIYFINIYKVLLCFDKCLI